MTQKVKLSRFMNATIHDDGYVTICKNNSFILIREAEMYALTKAYTSRQTETEGLGDK